jgi:hypothetical protein
LFRLRAKLALTDLEFDSLVLLQSAVSGALDRAEVDEEVRASAIRGDESVTLLSV